jgi:hypothetical protein
MAEPADDPLAETGQVIGGALRTGAVAAGEVVRMRLMRQAHEDRQAAVADQLAARTLTQRLRAERAAAAAIYRPTHDPSWWDLATADDVARAWDAAAAFSDTDPDARAALADLDRGLEERPALRQRLLRDHPESLAAQSLPPLATQPAEVAGMALAAAADLEIAHPPDPSAAAEDEAWYAARVALAELEPHDPPDAGPTPEEQAWYTQQRAAEELSERASDLSAPAEEAAYDDRDTDSWPHPEGDWANADAQDPGHDGRAAIAELVAADFPGGDSMQPAALVDVSAGGADTGGITRATRSGATSSEHEQAAGVSQLVGDDFPPGVATPLPRRGRARTMGNAPWEVTSGLPRGLPQLPGSLPEPTAAGVHQ